jgi:riboflavin kinase/FMN adenylyltransferase
MEKVAEYFGCPYVILGTVIHGKKLGRTIGFPTINILATMDRIYPPNGVYLTSIHVYDKEYMGITNIGYNPTVNGTQKMIETYIFDFEENIYGQEVTVTFHCYLRKEQKFASLEDLVKQLEKDKETAKSFIKNNTFKSLQPK